MFNFVVIFTGTDPKSAMGGIGVVMGGYFTALDRVGIKYEFISTYDPTSKKGKWLPWLKAFPKLIKSIQKLKRTKFHPVVYSHAGAGVSLFREACILAAARLMGVKTLVQIHAPQIDGYLDKVLSRCLLRTALMPANTVCLLTPWWKERLERSDLNGHFVVIPNPLPQNLEKVAEKIQAGSKSKEYNQLKVTVLSMARLVVGKGFDVVIQAMVQLPDNVKLIVAGDGELRGRLELLVKEIGVENRVSFLGWVAGEEKRKLLQDADIFCLPSINDAFPISMVEAMCHGLPVVGVRYAGISDMIADGRSGILVESPAPTLVAEAIKELLDCQRRQFMGAEAQKWVLELSSAETVGKKLAAIVHDLA